MDAGLIGGLIGLGVMVCGVGTAVCYDKGGKVLAYFKRKYTAYRQSRQPLLPVRKTNPVLVRTSSNQWKMKELVAKK
jgi:hypothetical protein